MRITYWAVAMVLFVFIDMMPLHITLFQAFFKIIPKLSKSSVFLAPVMLSLETSSTLTLLMANLHTYFDISV